MKCAHDGLLLLPFTRTENGCGTYEGLDKEQLSILYVVAYMLMGWVGRVCLCVHVGAQMYVLDSARKHYNGV